MVAIDILKFETTSPADTSPLKALNSAGYEASQILAVIGKTEGHHHQQPPPTIPD
jgi:cyanuric acid amidohydrolase